MILLTEYFTSTNANRDFEYKTCIRENLNCLSLDKVIIFISDETSELGLESDKLEIIKLKERPTFKFLFEWCNLNYPDKVCIIGNTDIIYDDTLENLNGVDLENKFVALTRWDIIPKDSQLYLQFYDLAWRGDITTGMLSQDSWIFKTPIKIDDRSNFLMGKLGCDNRIVQIYHELGYDVKNPSKKIVTKHLHASNYRTYSQSDAVLGPYLLIQPTDDVNAISRKQTISHF